MVLIDADGAVAGRLSARVAKLLLAGQRVEIINAEKAVMLGKLTAAKQKYLKRRLQTDKQNPEHSPKWPRLPHLFLRKMVRGMLPYKSQRGRDAFKRLRVSEGQAKEGKPKKIPEASSEAKHGMFTIKELCGQLGHKSE